MVDVQPPQSQSQTGQEKASLALSPGLMKGIKALDEAVIAAGNPGPPGSGVYLVLETAANQFLGIPRAGFPADPPADPTAHETVAPSTHASSAEIHAPSHVGAGRK